jgi:hypothetical protein
MVLLSALWRYLTRRQLLPWMLRGSALGEHVLELGAGAGPATLEVTLDSRSGGFLIRAVRAKQ